MSTIYEDLLENKGLKYYRTGQGLIEIGDKPAGLDELGRSCSVETMDGKMLDNTLQLIDATGIDYFIGVFKNPSVIEKYPDFELNKIYQRARLSLKSMMKILLLRNEFYHIDLQYQAQNKTKSDFGLIILKLLLRCKKMMEAKAAVSRIISMTFVRNSKISQLKDQFYSTEPSLQLISKFYAEIVRLSSRISDKVHILKNEEKCFMRPFVFSGVRYDEPELHMY
jgi:hypothetical protein